MGEVAEAYQLGLWSFSHEKEMSSIERWGSREAILGLGKKMNEMVYHASGKRFFSFIKQVELYYSWFPHCTDRRTRKIGKHWLFETLVETQDNTKVEGKTYIEKSVNGVYEKEGYNLFELAASNGLAMQFLMDRSSPEECYRTCYVNGTAEERQFIDEYMDVRSRLFSYAKGFGFGSKFYYYPTLLKQGGVITHGRERQYILMNPVYTIKSDERRITGRITELHTLYAELDHYKCPEWKNLSAQELEKHVLERLQEVGFPQHTEAIYSRGLQLVWKIGPIPEYRMEDWRLLERKITMLLSDLGADPHSTDPVRVLRAAGAIHEKTGRKIWGRSYTDDRYDFDELFAYFCADEKEKLDQEREKKRRKAISAQQKKLEQQFSIVDGANQNPLSTTKKRRLSKDVLDNPYNFIHEKRKLDIFLLSDLRKGDMEGCREFACFYVYYLTLCITGGNNIEAMRTMKELFDGFAYYDEYTWEIMQAKVSNVYRAYERWKENNQRGYNYSSQRLIEMLHIKPHEMAALTHIMSEEEASRRKRERDKARYKVSHDITRDEILSALKQHPSLSDKKIAAVVKEKVGKCSHITVMKIRKGLKGTE